MEEVSRSNRDIPTQKIKNRKWDHSSAVEQATHNRLVAGSNPAGPTKKKIPHAEVFLFFYISSIASVVGIGLGIGIFSLTFSGAFGLAMAWKNFIQAV